MEIKRKRNRYKKWGVYLGSIFIIMGGVWLLVALGIIPSGYLRFWPQVLLIILGALIIIRSIGR